MIQIDLPNDITDYAPRVIGPFTMRQIVCTVIGGAYAVPIAMALPFDDYLIKAIAGAVLITPALACGWIDVYGMPLERFAWQVIKFMFVNSPVRVYRQEKPGESLKGLIPEEPEKSGKKKVLPSEKYKAYR